MINGDGNGNIVFDRRILLPLGFVIFVIGVAVSATAWNLKLESKIEHNSYVLNTLTPVLARIDERTLDIDKRLAVLEARYEMEMSPIMEMQESDSLYIEMPYKNLDKRDIWLDLGGLENGDG